MCDTVISENNGGAKYKIYPRKKTATNITMNKMTERLEYNTLLECTDD